jgi:hypothetical protein
MTPVVTLGGALLATLLTVGLSRRTLSAARSTDAETGRRVSRLLTLLSLSLTVALKLLIGPPLRWLALVACFFAVRVTASLLVTHLARRGALEALAKRSRQ